MQEHTPTGRNDPEPFAYVSLLDVQREIGLSRATLRKYLAYLGIEPICFHIGTRSLYISRREMAQVAQQQHLWQWFDQEPRTPVQSGAKVGLGLYLCQQLISRQQGHVGVESTEGKGATFWFTCPLLSSLSSLPTG